MACFGNRVVKLKRPSLGSCVFMKMGSEAKKLGFMTWKALFQNNLRVVNPWSSIVQAILQVEDSQQRIDEYWSPPAVWSLNIIYLLLWHPVNLIFPVNPMSLKMRQTLSLNTLLGRAEKMIVMATYSVSSKT